MIIKEAICRDAGLDEIWDLIEFWDLIEIWDLIESVPGGFPTYSWNIYM